MTNPNSSPALPEWKEHSIHRDHGNLYVRDFPGSEPAFVVLHGFPDNSKIYDKLIPYLSQAGRRTIAIDFLGFGASDKPTNVGYNFEQQLGDLEATVAQLDLKSIIPVGHDAGGPAAVNFALRHPDLTAAVVMLNSFYSDAPGLLVPEIIDFFSMQRLQPLHQYIAASPQNFAWLFGFQRTTLNKGLNEEQSKAYDEFLGPIVDENFAQQPSAVPAFLSMTYHLQDELKANTARLAELRQCSVPFTFIWGRIDPYLHVSTANWLESQMLNAKIHPLEAGHWPQIDEPAKTAEIMVSLT